jgi:RNA polymerase sigma-70 factor (ECF subfamily)
VAPSFTEALEEGSVMRTALGRLSTNDREILLLAAWERLSGPALAAAVGCSRTAAAVRLFRARRRFAAALADAEAPPSVRLTDTRGRLLDEN